MKAITVILDGSDDVVFHTMPNCRSSFGCIFYRVGDLCKIEKYLIANSILSKRFFFFIIGMFASIQLIH